MLNEYKILLELVSAGALGREPAVSEKVSGEVLTLAKENGVFGIVLPAAKKLYDRGLLEISDAEMKEQISAMAEKVINYSRRQYAVNKVMKQLSAQGISCVMLKGDILGVMYKNPDLRMSGDTDLLIDIKDEKKCLNFFKNEGAYVKKRTPSNNQSVIVHPTGGTFEIHVSMDTKQISEVWYDGTPAITEPFREVTVGGAYTYQTLGYTDGAVSLAFHFVKHFVGGIAHIRMITDMLLYFSTYHDQIDFERFWNTIDRLKYGKIFRSLMYIGHEYYGFKNLESSEEYKAFADKLLCDIGECCAYGYERLEESGGIYQEYSRRRYSTFKNGDYKKYQIKILILDAYTLIFKDKYEMMKLYPILLKRRYLPPFMYIYRAFSCVGNVIFGRSRKKTEKRDEKLKELLNERMKLINELDMI